MTEKLQETENLQASPLEKFNRERLDQVMNELGLQPTPEAELSEEELKEFGIEVDKEDKVPM